MLVRRSDQHALTHSLAGSGGMTAWQRVGHRIVTGWTA
jgi:hypothetical protein